MLQKKRLCISSFIDGEFYVMFEFLNFAYLTTIFVTNVEEWHFGVAVVAVKVEILALV